MKLLLDENLPHELRHFLGAHDVFTAAYMGWSSLENGELLAEAAAENFDALITMDASIEHEQNRAALPLAIVILEAKKNDINNIRPVLPKLLEALWLLKPRTIVHVRAADKQQF